MKNILIQGLKFLQLHQTRDVDYFSPIPYIIIDEIEYKYKHVAWCMNMDTDSRSKFKT